MSDYSELERRAQEATGFDDVSVAPDVLLELIAENKRLNADCSSMLGSLKASALSIKKLIKDGGRAARERDQLRAENAGLKTGYEAYERVNAELKAECEALRKDADRFRRMRAMTLAQIEDTQDEFDAEFDRQLGAAMGKGGRP